MLGVLGGMGPAAGAYFAYRLALLTGVGNDQQHLPVLLRNDPRIPDRSEAVVGHGQSPLPATREGLRFLEASGCTCAAIPCNTAHHWHAELKESVKIPVLNIVSSVLARLQGNGLEGGRIGLLGTPGTVHSGLYRDPLSGAGYAVLPLTKGELQDLCVRPIQAVKQNRLDEAAQSLEHAISVLANRGAAAVVLGCTEIPVAMAALGSRPLALPVVDSIDALALDALAHFGYATKGGPIA